MLIERSAPRAHIVMDDFFAPEAVEAIFRELPSIAKRMKPGLVRDLGHDGQSVFFAHRRRQNKAVWIHDPSRTLRLFRDALWADEMVAAYAQMREPLFQIIPHCWASHLQVSSYLTGDHYDFHEDEGAGVNLTAIVFLAADPAKVHGGDLVLAYDGQETKVRFRHNRLLVFPSKTLHRVTRVRVDGDDPSHARISLQCWLTYGRPPEKPKRRAPEADRPTFLLAEDAILEAARALTTGAAAEQTTEDLYWGAFYLSRILSQNLRCLAEEHAGLRLGRILVRRGEDLEVYGRTKSDGVPMRIGFRLGGPATANEDALRLFVETGRGKTATCTERVVPRGAEEEEAAAVLQHLLFASSSQS